MYLTMLKSKIHRATVTEANLNYVGSITIDGELLEKSGILPGEKVYIVNNNNGARLETYVIEGEKESGVICLNGAAARLVQPGDIVIIMAYALMDKNEALNSIPTILILDEKNKIKEILSEEVHGDIK
ncbi:aspartate 1-decarboxylase [Tissierella pigra]|uniref:Aspartate 1-decarboxylase n=1 Tax=Tissierella pigra TaxID=2607614 RepID=A0A6N7Y4S4_9FIRM|nr:aspartate 1-decarboxylase [Tissierella pigra]MBU5427348.1 aspartate 1-decarboxylase [Tissierella pigra]MSU03060.1 aspartate 1-decarboxylase [Tissierella pigra]